MQDYPSRSRETFSNYDDVLSNGRRSYNFTNMQKSLQISQTDKRIEEIKRKYDTPNRRERISQLSVKKSDPYNKENDHCATADFKTKMPNLSYEGSEAGLKESKAISNSRQSFFNNPSSASKSYLGSGLAREKQSFDSRQPTNKLYTNQNQEQFFKRVKEMKQSLLYGDNSTKQPEMKTSIFYPTRQSRTASGFYDSNQTVEKDRIDNIDKINQKIKGILECLNENEKTRIPSSKYELQKRSKVQNTSTTSQQFNNNTRQIARTPVKNVVTSSIGGRQNFGNLRQQRSEILDKIIINRDFKDENVKKQQPRDDDRWQKLSSKLEKYEMENKLRLQKAFDYSKEIEKPREQPTTQNIIENIRRQKFDYQGQEEYKRPIEVHRRDNRSMDLRELRSRSYLNPQTSSKDIRDRSLHSREMTGLKEYEMKSGKKLDDEIDRIQRKIQQFEEEKKRLNINFKPFNYSNTKSTSNLGLNYARNDNRNIDYSERKITDFNNRSLSQKDLTLNCRSKQNLREEFEKVENQETFREKKDFSQLDNFQDGSFNRLDSKIQIKLEKSNPSSVRTSKFISHSSSRVSKDDEQNYDESFSLQKQTKKQIQSQQKPAEKPYKFFLNENLKRQTDEGIEERKKKLLNYSENNYESHQELKDFVKSLCDQVKLDEEFRNAKIWFEYYSNPQKDEEVKKLFPQKSLEEIRDIFKVRESENNPFFTTQGYEASVQMLINLYRKSQSHWNDKLHKKFDKNTLENQGFTERQIDLQKKGHINLGDLVRFLNLQSGTFYRNRDLSLIFIRVAKQHNSPSFTEVSFGELEQSFCG